jgi:pimeloyl-ACP methyl ester carboxylesterase
VRSLTSIMSNTGNHWKGQPALGVMRFLLRQAPEDRDRYIAHMARLFAAIGSTGLPQDTEFVRERAARSYDRDHDRAGSGRQLGAVVASGDRTDELRRITAPTLVIHGTADRLVRPSGGMATTSAIRGARLMLIEGMGHDLPSAAWPELVDAIAGHARSVDEMPAAA